MSDLAAVELSEPALIWRVSVAAPAHRRTPAAARAFLGELLRDPCPAQPGYASRRANTPAQRPSG